MTLISLHGAHTPVVISSLLSNQIKSSRLSGHSWCFPPWSQSIFPWMEQCSWTWLKWCLLMCQNHGLLSMNLCSTQKLFLFLRSLQWVFPESQLLVFFFFSPYSVSLDAGISSLDSGTPPLQTLLVYHILHIV